MKYFTSNSAVLWYSFKRELRCIFKSRIFITLLLLLPLGLFTFFCYFYSRGTLSELDVAVYDADNSELSRTIVRAIDVSKTMRISGYLKSIDEIETGIQHNAYNAVFYIPDNFEKNIKTQHAVTIQFYKNSHNTLIASALYKDALQVVKSINAGIIIKKLRASSLNSDQAKAIVQPVIMDTHYIGNPPFNYNNFLSPAYIYVCCQIILMLAGMFSITHEIDDKRYTRIIESAYNFTGALIIGKAVAILLVFGAVIAFLHLLLFPLFNITIHCSLVNFIMYTFLFLASSLLPGMAIGAFVKEAFLATEVIIFVNMPSLLVSGYTFPSVPTIFADIANILPFVHFMHIFIKSAQLGASIDFIHKELLSLGILFSIFFIFSWIFVFRLSKSIEKAGA
ncbi:MAG TPA: ABC transporter permease [Chitinispirillaceae bacterium]|nr:ABC transporter permease [Chitinispirillaceae bacterium]